MSGKFSVQTLIENGLQLCGRKCRVNGTVKSLRKQKQLYFLGLNDGSSDSNLQVVIPTNILDESIQSGDVLSIDGQLVRSHRIEQQVELVADSIPLIASCDRSYPLLNPSKMSLDQIRKSAHLQSRIPYFRNMLLLRSSAEFAFHDFYRRNGFVKVTTPVLTMEDCEGAGEMFTVNTEENRNDESEKSFFDQSVHLTVSGQLHLESLVNGLGNVYTFGPAFRAENSRTIRHLCEFYMIEAEMSFVNSVDEVMGNAEECVKFSIESLLSSSHQTLKQLWQKVDSSITFADLKQIVGSRFVRIPFEEAIRILNIEMSCQLTMHDQLLREHELFLTEKFNSPVFVYDYPKQQKAFYARENEDGVTCSSFDLLVPRVSELAGGGVREERLRKLEEKFGKENHKVNEWYLDLRRYGSIPHGGYGIGFERFLLWITGSTNIRNTIPFARFVNSCQM